MSNDISEEAANSLLLLTEYATEANLFNTNTVRVLDELMNLAPTSDDSQYYLRTLAPETLGYIAAMGNDEALMKLIRFIKGKKNWDVTDVMALKIVTENRSIAKIFFQDHQDIIKRLKDILIQNQNKPFEDYYFAYQVATILEFVGEEAFIIDFLDKIINNKNTSEQLKLAVAEAVYKYDRDERNKIKGLEAIIALYRNNPRENRWIQGTTGCILYKIGKPSIERLGEVSQDNPKLQEDTQLLIEAINNSNPNIGDQNICGPEGAGDPGWWAKKLVSHFSSRQVARNDKVKRKGTN